MTRAEAKVARAATAKERETRIFVVGLMGKVKIKERKRREIEARKRRDMDMGDDGLDRI